MPARITVLLLALLVVLGGCSDDFLDQLDLSEEDREALEELNELAGEIAEASGEGSDGAGSDGDGSDRPQDPDWTPPDMPPPPGEPTESKDTTDTWDCQPGLSCGRAVYEGDGEAARDHYEEIFGRPPDSERQSEDIYGEVTRSVWDDGDVEVHVTTLSDEGKDDRTFVDVWSED